MEIKILSTIHYHIRCLQLKTEKKNDIKDLEKQKIIEAKKEKMNISNKQTSNKN